MIKTTTCICDSMFLLVVKYSKKVLVFEYRTVHREVLSNFRMYMYMCTIC